MPVPMIAPMPSVIRLMGPSERRSECVPVSDASAMMVDRGFLASRGMYVEE